jgi:hypothetical protein
VVKRLPVRNLRLMKAVRDVLSFFKDGSFKIRNNQPILLHTLILEYVCATLRVTVGRILKKLETQSSPGKKVFSLQQII